MTTRADADPRLSARWFKTGDKMQQLRVGSEADRSRLHLYNAHYHNKQPKWEK